MQNFISSFDLLCWNIVLKGNSAKSMTTNNDGNPKIRPPITAEEHQQVQREDKATTILVFALPDEHMGDFYHMIDARDIWNAIRARFGGNAKSKKMQKSLLKRKFKEFKISEEEGLDKGYDKMQKILTQMNTLKIKPDPEDINMKFLRGSPSSWSGNSGYGGYTTTLSASPDFSSSKGSSKFKCSVVDDVLYSFFANHEINQQLVYEDLDQMNKDEFEEYDLKHQMAMLSIKVHSFEKKHGRKIKFNGRENARFDKKLVKCFNCKQMGHFLRECRAQGAQTSNNYQKYKSKEAGKNGSDSKAMVIVDGSIDWDNSMLVRTKQGLGLDKYIRKGKLGIDDSVFSIFHTTSDDLEGQPIYNRFASVDNMKAVPPPLTGNYMPPSNIPDIDESQMVYRKTTTDSSEIKTNDDSISHSHDSVLFDFSDRSSKPSTNDFQTYDSSQEYSRPNRSNHDSNDSISSVSASASASSDTIVIDCARQEDFPSVCTSSIKTDVNSSKTLCNKFGSFNKESNFRKNKPVTSKSCYVCGSYLHLIKDFDFHEQTFAKRNAEGKGKLGRRPTRKPVNPNRPNPVSTGQRNTLSTGQPYTASAGQPNPVSA
nr:ribonuclease H-like domain-containing protein [Tanacetum cinerariifolium]